MMTPWYLIAVVVLGAGCEQLKAPKRIHELEGRVNELTTEVAALKAGSGATKPKPVEHAGSGSAGEAHAAGSGEPHAEGSGEAHAEGSGQGSDQAHAAGSGDSQAGSGEPPAAAGSAAAAPSELHDGSGREATVEPAVDAGVPPDTKPPGLEQQIQNAVAKATEAAGPGHDKHAEPHWTYDGATGPPAWGALDPAWRACATGKAQSPIDIEPRASTASPIAFHYKATAASIIDNGHTLQVNLVPGSSIEIDGRAYDLVQFHFHTPSEHTIAGEHYPLEVHLVHRGGGGKLAVIGVLYDTGADSKPLAALWASWPHKVGAAEKLRRPFDPSVLLPETRTVFRYPGSLTTPPCAEGVLWNVMRRTMSDTREHLELFGQHYAYNAREVQTRNDRKVD